MYTYSLTWDRVTAASCSEGDTDGNGFVIDGERVQLDHANLPGDEVNVGPFESLADLLADVEDFGPWREWSCSHPTPDHSWLCSDEHGSLDCGDEEVFSYHLHVRQADGSRLTPEQFSDLRAEVGR